MKFPFLDKREHSWLEICQRPLTHDICTGYHAISGHVHVFVAWELCSRWNLRAEQRIWGIDFRKSLVVFIIGTATMQIQFTQVSLNYSVFMLGVLRQLSLYRPVWFLGELSWPGLSSPRQRRRRRACDPRIAIWLSRGWKAKTHQHCPLGALASHPKFWTPSSPCVFAQQGNTDGLRNQHPHSWLAVANICVHKPVRGTEGN